MPTDEEIKAYVDKLPAIYRDVMAAFPAVSPVRREGDGLTADSIHDCVEGPPPGHRSDDVFDALMKLVARGFLSQHNKIVFAPTPIGERLITAITGHKPAPYGIPDLPAPTWG